jgi:hypothetical protein
MGERLATLECESELTGPREPVEHLPCTLDLAYNWSYEQTRKDLRDLYRKAKRNQWNADEVLPWDTDVDPEKSSVPEHLFPIHDSPYYRKWTPAEVKNANVELASWVTSQFLHGEQGALLAASQLAVSVPDIDSKYYAATQVVDEARHVEVYDRYVHEKIGFSYPITPSLKKLLDLILLDSRWDMKLLGMQIMVEGLALAAFNMIRVNSTEPLLGKLVQYVMLDEARHVAYGVLSLKNHYDDMKESERREREDFVYESAVLMRDRFLYDQLWEKLGLPVAECKRIASESETQQMFRQMLFSKVVPAVKKIGLLSPRQRERFEKLGILQFESWADPFESLDSAELPPR